MRGRFASLVASAFLSWANWCGAESLDAVPLEGKKIRIDGMLREWPKLSPLSQVLSGRPSSGARSASAAVGYDPEYLYVGARIKDAHLKRTKAFGAGEDHLAIRLAIPVLAGGYTERVIRVFAGEPGKSSGAVRVDKKLIKTAKVVEAPEANGYLLEARIPWSALPAARWVRSGIRAAIVYSDAEPGKKSVVGTSKQTGKRMPLLTFEPEFALGQALLKPKALGSEPVRELVGNVAGDKMTERIAVYGRYLAITGWNYRGGKGFYYHDLKTRLPSDLKGVWLRDFDLDGRQEVVIHRRRTDGSRFDEYLEVWSFRGKSEQPRLILQHAVGTGTDAGSVTNTVAIRRKKGQWGVDIGVGEHAQLNVEEWDQPVTSGDGVFPLLLPWQSIEHRRLAVKDGRFEIEEEKTGTPKVAGKRLKGRNKMWSGKAPPHPKGEGRSVAPRPTSAGEKQERVFSLYRREQGSKAGKLTFDLMANVAGDGTPERIVVDGKNVVVMGKAFKGGESYAYTTLPLKANEHVLHVTTMDVTGDALAEIIVRAIIPVKVSKTLGGGTATRYALFVYEVSPDGLSKIFAVETGRALEDKRVLAELSFVEGNRGKRIIVRGGRAFGWVKGTYPFPVDKHPYGGLQPLLLPWSEPRERAYDFAGRTFEAVD